MAKSVVTKQRVVTVVIVLLAILVAGLVFNAARTIVEGPSGPPGKFDVVFEDDFNKDVTIPPTGSTGDSSWGAYSGPGGGNKYAYWSPANVSVSGGQLHLASTIEGDRIVTGGVGNDVTQTYGQWEVRMRMPLDPNVKFVLQLWPETGWPPEIDFAEAGGKLTNSGIAAFFHWGDEASQQPGSKQQIRSWLPDINTANWHTFGVRWRTGQLQYLVDGDVWSTVSTPNVPSQPMWLAIQTEGRTTASKATSKSIPGMDVDYVRISKWTPAPAS